MEKLYENINCHFLKKFQKFAKSMLIHALNLAVNQSSTKTVKLHAYCENFHT